MSDADFIIVGSGINALTCAAMLARKGRKVLMLERNPRIGGCILTDEITLPGFVHDVMAMSFTLFIGSRTYAALGAELAQRGLSFADSDTPTGVLLPDGRHAILTRDHDRNVAAFEKLQPGEGPAFESEMRSVGADLNLIAGLLGGALWSLPTLAMLAGEIRRRGLRGLAETLGEFLTSSRGYLETRYRSDVMRALFAPWALHCGLGPESAYGGQMVKVIGAALESAGAPIVRGGAARLVGAFERFITDSGGAIRVSADVDRVELDARGRASGVRLADGGILRAKRGVICSVAPDQLYRRLLRDNPLPNQVACGLAHFRHGKGDMQIHYALSAPPRWTSPELAGVALLHLTDGLDGVSRATNECERGLLPASPTVCVGQPTVLDPSRAPPGKAVLWLQLPEAPRIIKGDAAGEIETPADGRWSEQVRELYADRIEAILARNADGFRDSILARRVYSPSDLETLNINLVNGDPYGGFCGLDQFFIWRPFKSSVNHETHVARLYHIGASTHPGPGLSGDSGFLLARKLA